MMYHALLGVGNHGAEHNAIPVVDRPCEGGR